MSSIVNSVIGGVSGTTVGGAGMNYQAGNADVINPLTTAQTNQAIGNAQTGVWEQGQLMNSLQQSGSAGRAYLSDTASQLQDIANGTGPNPAKAQLAQATAANTANQAALMAGQRGASQNVGLMARQAAQQGAQNQQGAVGQAATLQANQSLGALGQLGGIAQQQISNQQAATQAYSSSAANQEANMFNSLAGVNSASVQSMGSQNAANASLAGIVANQQGKLVGGALGGAAVEMAQGGEVQRFDGGGPVQPAPPVQATSVTNPYGPQSKLGQYVNNYMNNGESNPYGQVGQALGRGIKALYKQLSSKSAPSSNSKPSDSSKPSDDSKSSDGSQSSDGSNGSAGDSSSAAQGQEAGAQTGDTTAGGATDAGDSASAAGDASDAASDVSDVSDAASDVSDISDAADAASDVSDASDAIADVAARGGIVKHGHIQHFGKGGSIMSLIPALISALKDGGEVPALVSPGEVYLPPHKVKEVAKKGKSPLKVGKKVPGKPKYPGNDYRNDTVPTTLEEGGIVIPNKVLQSRNPEKAAHRFVSATLAKKGHLPKK